MGTVSIARKVGAAGFERLVVVKRVHPVYAQNREFAEMFRDEARICSTIRHPNVAAILDVVEADGELLLVLEYVESLSLSALLRAARERGLQLAADVVVRIVADALAGLHAAHEAKDMRGVRLDLIHRDVSPHNVIVGLDGSSRLIDFGIAKAASRSSVTSSGVLKGKLRYMSPEQVRRRPLDRRADVFAAGVVLFEALTGQELFAGEDEGDIVLGILSAEVPSPSSLVPGLSLEVDRVVHKALARDREERYQTAAEFGEELEHALTPASPRAVSRAVETFGGERLEERRAQLRASLEEGPGGQEALAVADAALTIVEPPSPIERGSGVRVRARTLTVLGLCALAAVTAATVLALRGRAAPSPAPNPTASESAPLPPSLPAQVETAASATASVTASVAAPESPRTPRSTPRGGIHRHNPYGAP
jgi:serine/threonine protein kinase